MKQNNAGTFKITENWQFILKDKNGNVIQEFKKTNVVTNAWKTVLRDWMYDGSGDNPVALAIGTGTTSQLATDTSLETEYSRETATATKPASYQVKFSKDFTFSSGTSENITEAGLFDSAIISGSVMIARTTFTAIPVTGSVTLTVTSTITIAGS